MDDIEDVGAGTVRPAGPPSNEDGSSSAGPAAPKSSPLDKLKQKAYKGQWHMKPVRVVHARVQSDAPAYIDGRFVSSFGNGDLAKGYLSAMDSVNTASVEGALMYVQAEGINVNSRSPEDRCVRKNGMRNIVFYDIAIVQTNETIAEFGSTWQKARDTFEYGPMVPMDGGRCTAEAHKGTKEILPKACLQYNGDNGLANLGPMIGGSLKDDDVRAPYPNTYWFSFPNTCPQKKWAEKTDKCRSFSRKGLCDIGVAPDGVQCTYAYDILGWISIDDVVGITSITNKATGMAYSNFTEWCNASTKNNEFVGDSQTGEMTSGLSFWKKPLDSSANEKRAKKVVEIYNQLVAGKFESTQISKKTVKLFKPLPDLDTLRESNPPCYESVPTCNSKEGCRREGFSQICKPCETKEDGCMSPKSGFEFPKLAKAPVADDAVDPEAEATSSSTDGASSSAEQTNIESPNAPPESGKSSKKKASTSPAASAATTQSPSLVWTMSALVVATAAVAHL
jgi:hypothetical protein